MLPNGLLELIRVELSLLVAAQAKVLFLPESYKKKYTLSEKENTTSIDSTTGMQ